MSDSIQRSAAVLYQMGEETPGLKESAQALVSDTMLWLNFEWEQGHQGGEGGADPHSAHAGGEGAADRLCPPAAGAGNVGQLARRS